MFKNKIAMKLASYFAVCILVFSCVIGGLFMILFRNHTVALYRNQLEQRALSIAETLSGFMHDDSQIGGDLQGKNRQRGYGAYLRFLKEIAMADVWVLNEELELITQNTLHYNNETAITYKDFPADADRVINEVFSGKTDFSESFSSMLNQRTITVGTPIKNGNKIIGVVLLHAPVNGINAAIGQGLMMLGISMAVALVIAFLLSLWLSKSFTDPIICKEAKEALQLEKLRRDFVANISHELKTPVAVLRGSLEALAEEVVTEPAQVKSYYQEMLSETVYLQRLVGDLLDLSRLQNTDFSMELKDVNIGDVLSDAVRSITHLAKEKQVKITLQQLSHSMVRGDYGRLRQMMLIILDNAVKFSSEQGVIEVTANMETISIRDYGIGFSDESLPYLFDRFYKSSSDENKIGTGLGLAIAKQIAERHHFVLKAESMGTGARFVIMLTNTESKGATAL